MHKPRIEAHRNRHIVPQQVSGIEVSEHFESGKGLGLCDVDYGYALRIPPTAIPPCPFAGEGHFSELALDDSPSCDVQAKTPCSSWPIRSSTSRAPISVCK